jgi:hypothetical protein
MTMYNPFELQQRTADKLIKKLGLDREDLPKRLRGFIQWFSYRFFPFFMSIAIFMGIFYGLTKVHDKYGLDKIIMIAVAVYLMRQMRGK